MRTITIYLNCAPADCLENSVLSLGNAGGLRKEATDLRYQADKLDKIAALIDGKAVEIEGDYDDGGGCEPIHFNCADDAFAIVLAKEVLDPDEFECWAEDEGITLNA